MRDVIDNGASLLAVLGGGDASHAAPEPDCVAPASAATAHVLGEPHHAAAQPAVDELLLRLVDVGDELTSVMLGPIKGVGPLRRLRSCGAADVYHN